MSEANIYEVDNGLRIRIYHQGRRYSENHPGDLSTKHWRKVIKRRDHIKSRIEIGLPINEGESTTIQTLFVDWLETQSLRHSTVAEYETTFHRFWRPFFSLTPETISKPMIRSRLGDVEVGGKTKKNALSILKSVIDYSDHYPNPCVGIPIQRDQKEPLVLYTPDERAALLRALSGESQIFFTVFAATGMRTGEILALDWSRYDGKAFFVERQVVRRRLTEYTKTGKSRKVFVPTWARKVIEQHSTRFKKSFVLLNANGDFHRDAKPFLADWHRAHKRLGIEYRRPYALRHLRVSELISSGMPPAAIAAQTGHGIETLLRTYAQFLEAWSDDYEEMLEGRSASLEH